MAQQLLAELPEKTTQQIARGEVTAEATRSGHGGSLSPLLQLQRTLGNQRVAQLIQAKRLTPQGKILSLQPKLTVGAGDDQYEQEADRVARQVVSMTDAAVANSMQRTLLPEEIIIQEIQTKPLTASITPVIQRQMENDNEEDKDKPLQPKSGPSLAGNFDAGAEVESRLSQSKGGGSPLPDPVRAYMEPRFGVDFSHVRVHTSSNAEQMNRDVGAQAFTHGSDIYYGAGIGPTNLELTAHELTHVVQQEGIEVQRKCNDCGTLVEKDKEPVIRTKPSTSVQMYVQRVHIENGRKKFDCADLIGDSKLEACLNDEDRLRPFDKGASVIKIQTGLQKDGQDLGVDGTTGVYGADTGKAVIAFKRKHNLGSTQFPDVGPGTTKKLDELCAASPKPPIPEPATPILPEPQKPDVPPGPVIPPGSPLEFCVPFLSILEGLAAHPLVVRTVNNFTAKFGQEVQDLWMKYLFNPKSGTKGTLPPRKLFSGQQSRVVQEFRQDSETQKQKDRIMKLIADRVRSDSSLMPLPGQSTPILDFRAVLNDSELLDLPMSFGDPGNKIPGLIAGGPAKGANASDAGDDVRNVDGKFRAINLGSSTFQVRADFIFDVFDCVDFCPGASGSGLALGLTIPMSKLEATPDVPTFDVPFEVIYALNDDQSF